MTALALCRFAHFMAAMLAFGASAYLWLYAPDNLRRALTPAIRRLTIGASLVALVSATVWLALEAASMADDWGAATSPETIATVLTHTSFGHTWIARLVLAAALVLASVFALRSDWATISILSALLLASLGLVGHAAMQTGAEGVLHRANHALHLLATGAWLGGLIPFLLCLREYTGDGLRREAVDAMTRFSFFGHFVVAAIIATGIANIALTSGHPLFPPTTPYRALLDAKIAIVAAMIALAVFNRYRLVPRLARKASALAALRLTSAIEVALGTVVVGLVSVFALLDPA
jgi:putative copper resistance protein D